MKLAHSKRYLLETLKHYNVNHVQYYDLRDFASMHFDTGKLFSLRCLSSQAAKFYYGVSFAEVCTLLATGDVDAFRYVACDSLKVEDRTSLLANGEVSMCIDTRFTHHIEKHKRTLNLYRYDGFINTVRGQSCRQSADSVTDKSKRLIKRWQDVPKCLLNFLWSKQLVNRVIEFSIYNKPVGIKKEELLIWEVRNY